MQTIRCIVVDDESISRKFLEHYIQQFDFLELVQSCSNAKEAISVLQQHKIDIAFLDIEMPGKSGLQMLEELSYRPAVILVTAKEQYAVKAYEMDVIDYLVKPISFSRFEKAIAKAKKLIETNSPTLIEEELFIKVNAKLVKVAFTDIVYVEAQGDYVQVHTADKKYIMYISMSEILRKLPESKFARVHRSFIINIGYVKGVENSTILLNELKIPLGVSYKKGFISRIKN